MTTTFANINPEIVHWARQRSQLSLAVLAEKINVTEEKLEGWEMGTISPTFPQAKKIAKKTHIPFGYLFLDTPPEERIEIPDLRTIGNEAPAQPSTELLDLINIMTERSNWYAEFLRDQGITKNPNVGRFTIDATVDEIVADIRQVLGVSLSDPRGTNEENYFRLLVSRIEQAGILVMKQATIRNHRKLSVDEFRGFAINDPLAPLVFVNLADIKSASLFTLIHELAHIWLGESALSDGSFDTDQQLEIKCNAIAAEFLVPQEDFQKRWRELDDWRQNIPELTSIFHTSRWVIARRAQTLGRITIGEYREFVAEMTAEHNNRDRPKGGNYYQNINSQISKPFSRAVISEASSGRVLLRDAGHLLDMKPRVVLEFAKTLGV